MEEKSQRLLLKPALCLHLFQRSHPNRHAQTREQSFRPSGLHPCFLGSQWLIPQEWLRWEIAAAQSCCLTARPEGGLNKAQLRSSTRSALLYVTRNRANIVVSHTDPSHPSWPAWAPPLWLNWLSITEMLDEEWSERWEGKGWGELSWQWNLWFPLQESPNSLSWGRSGHQELHTSRGVEGWDPELICFNVRNESRKVERQNLLCIIFDTLHAQGPELI